MRVPLLAVLLLCASAAAQPAFPCASSEADGLGFWIGEWELTWPGGQGGTPEGTTGSGTNTITRELGGCVVHERFVAGSGFEGESVSVYTPRGWRQTWVDNQGSYLLFTGGMADGGMEMRTAPSTNAQGQEQVSRMTWRNITDDALDWHWQRSTDGGATWTDLWVIRYTRR